MLELLANKKDLPNLASSKLLANTQWVERCINVQKICTGEESFPVQNFCTFIHLPTHRVLAKSLGEARLGSSFLFASNSRVLSPDSSGCATVNVIPGVLESGDKVSWL